jgi:hypothetical protein
MRVGLVYRCEHHLKPGISGQRTVMQVQANAIASARPGEDTLDRARWIWCNWGKASEWKIEGDSVTHLDQGQRIFTYHFDQEEPSCSR